MKKIAILVIAALNQPVYIHYIKSYWTEVIKHTNAAMANIDVFLIIEKGTPMDVFRDIEDNVIEDKNPNLEHLCEAQFQTRTIPGILSKTIYAFELLQDKYDVFFRTNLSSLIKLSAFDSFVQSKQAIVYSGALAWPDSLRQNLIHWDRIGAGKSIETLSELDGFKGNTFFSGSGYFLSSEEVRSLVKRKNQIRYDLVDDVSVGLMFHEYEVLDNFGMVVKPDRSVDEMMDAIRGHKATHIRLQYFPLTVAENLWRQLKDDPLWK